MPIAADLALPIDKGLLPITVPWRERDFGLRWRKDIEFKMNEFLSIDERALTHIVEDTFCGVAVKIINISGYV